jgi:DNA polymerase-3 subunit gamma/tau
VKQVLSQGGPYFYIMNYQVLARKWRPKSFIELVGQDPVVKLFQHSFAQGRIHHAYLFTGTRGVGKTTIARIIAKCLNCEEGVSATPCGVCSACVAIDEGRFIDLLEIDAASRTRVEDTRELLDNVQYAPTVGRFKIYLIDEVHMLSTHSFNALLKTLEEPPAHVKFLLATTDPEKLPITILSRCLQCHLKNVSVEVIEKQLEMILEKEGLAYEADALVPVAEAAEGSIRDALSLLDRLIPLSFPKVTHHAVQEFLGVTAKEDILFLFQSILHKEAADLLKRCTQMAEKNVNFLTAIDDWMKYLHSLMLSQVKGGEALLSPESLQLFYDIALRAKKDFPYALNAKAAFELMLIRSLCFMPGQAAEPLLVAKLPTEKKATHNTAAETSTESVHVDWPLLIKTLSSQGILNGALLLLAEHTVFEYINNDVMTLSIDENHRVFASTVLQKKLEEILSTHFKKPIKLIIQPKKGLDNTPAMQQEKLKTDEKKALTAAVLDDPTVQHLLNTFGASLDESQIKQETKQ